VSRLADDLFLICHNERSGRCRVTQRSAGIGLAAGMLAELVLGGHLAVRDGRLCPGPATSGPTDRMLQDVLASMSLTAMGPPRRDVATWLKFLAIEAVEDVRHRLIGEGAMAQVAARTLGRGRRTVYVPTDPNAAVWPAIRLAKHLSQGLPMTVEDKVLTGLVTAIGQLGDVLWLRPDHDPGWDRARELRRELSPELNVLVAHADALVGQGVLAGRSG
jgi:Golgi phosphoprotein 3 (GPP34)